ncbi:MAG TPA: DUF5666 domain-containing protein [Steroidobacteraceae bacterium]|nr:DUF5666 domain-containing protein [Steroidobacteraceae bacterium]
MRVTVQTPRSRQRLVLAATCASAVLLTITGSAGIQGSGRRMLIAVGPVTGSTGVTIQVGSDQYWVAGATIRVDGKPAIAAQLRDGDVVTLQGSTSNTHVLDVASDVIFEGAVRGAVDAVDPANSSFLVLGQQVLVTSSTVFDPLLGSTGISDLVAGALVEVSAVRNAEGNLIASRIDSRTAQAGSRVVGTATHVDPVRSTFNIGALTVDYRAATVSGALAAGEILIVDSTSFANSGVLVASQVSVQSPIKGLAGESGRFDGVITSLASPSYFEVNGIPVAVDSGTHLNLKGPLALDVSVSVSGTFDINGVLIADKVQTQRSDAQASVKAAAPG